MVERKREQEQTIAQTEEQKKRDDYALLQLTKPELMPRNGWQNTYQQFDAYQIKREQRRQQEQEDAKARQLEERNREAIERNERAVVWLAGNSPRDASMELMK